MITKGNLNDLEKIEVREARVRRLKRLNEIALTGFCRTVIQNYQPSDIRLVGDKLARVAEGVLIAECVAEANILKGVYETHIQKNEVSI